MEKAIKNLFYTLTVFASIGVVIAISFALAWPHLPTKDPASYFHFADRRTYFGIPNFFDVTSNLFFIYSALYGFFIYFSKYDAHGKPFWLAFLTMNLGLLLTAAGSSHFHLLVTPESLFWDRLPMAVVFASLVALIFTDRVHPIGSKFFLALLNILTLWTVWNLSHGNMSLRPYIAAQFGCILALVIIIIFFNYGRLSRKNILLAAGLYAVAKALEIYDHQVFALLGTMSGHTLKHIASAAAILAINSGVKNEPWRPYKK